MHDLDPLVAAWFHRKFPAPTEPQRDGWPLIREGRDVLISAPTGSGKTLAAFLITIDDLVRHAREGTLEDRTYAVYVSPLKALSNDIRKNLEAPLAEIGPPAPIRIALRTGDTPAWERQQMAKMPPHILVTTPESLFILLTAERSRKALSTTRTVIVDEIHAVAGSKRGSHLALSLARLDALVESNGLPRPQRIGLSATVSPIEDVARMLGDDVRIVEAGRRRTMDLAVEVPRDELGPIASNEMWAEIYDRIAALINEHRTTLVFVNTRRLAERVAHHLTERLGENAVLPHHGSLSRTLRLDAEERLKNGQLRAVVATASLELGIDIGTVDLACQIGSPRSLSVALQRFGRSGHWVGAHPKGRLFPSTRDELIECAALVNGLRGGLLDRIVMPRAPLDILAQQIVAAAACDDYAEDEMYALARRAFPYRDLPRSDFDDVIEMLSEGIATARGRSGAYLHRDRVNSRIRGRRGARLAAITSGGAIPDNANYLVVAEPEGTTVGTLDEDFAIESMAGDVFMLGTTSWRIRRVEQGRVRVEDAHGAAPTIPFWNGEAPGRTAELSAEVSNLREKILEHAQPVEFLIAECGLDRRGAEQGVEYVRAGRAGLPALPTQQTIVAERFFDEAGGMQLVIHAPFGARVNRAWGLSLRKRFCRSFNLELQAAATDNGIVISLTEQHAFPLETVFEFVNTSTLDHVLTQALLDAPMFTARWRWNCSRALAILRFAGGRKVPPPIQRMRADDLMAAVFPDQAACAENLSGEIRIPDHPLVSETIGDCLHEAMDLEGLRRLIAGIESGAVRTVAADTSAPSQFCHEILNANPFAYLDDAPLEERRARAVQLRGTVKSDFVDTMGALDEAAIKQVAEESWPLVRDADELHDALLTLVLLPSREEWRAYYDTLAAARRVSTLGNFWVAAERLDLARSLPNEDALAALLGGWLESSGPTTVPELSARFGIPQEYIAMGLAVLESRGLILSGRYTPGLPEGVLQWCNRRVLARIHRMTLGKLRREIEPVTTVEFLRFLARWQHVAPSTRLHGLDGLLEVIRQLEGYEIPAAAWESHVLARRIENYEPELLDQLCLSGEVMWGRVSPHPAFDEPANGNGHRRVRPTRVAPIALFLREDFSHFPSLDNHEQALSHQAQEVLAVLRTRGASFFNELHKATTRLPAEIEEALWELVTAGLVTADGWENLRTLLDTRRRAPRPRHAAGRWSLFTRDGKETTGAEKPARLLLRRWGVVCRDLLARESLAPPWRDLLVELRRMEARGEIRGGRFVASLAGEQYALPEAVDLLRRVRREDGAESSLNISAADPLNLRGIVLPGPRVSVLEWDSVQSLA